MKDKANNTKGCDDCEMEINVAASHISDGQLQTKRIGPLKENRVYVPKIFFESKFVVSKGGHNYSASLERRYVNNIIQNTSLPFLWIYFLSQC